MPGIRTGHCNNGGSAEKVCQFVSCVVAQLPEPCWLGGQHTTAISLGGNGTHNPICRFPSSDISIVVNTAMRSWRTGPNDNAIG